MKLTELQDAAIRLLGGDPRRVDALQRGLRRAATGRMELLDERRGTGIPLEFVPILVGAVLAVLSMLLTGGTILLRARPDVAALLPCLAAALLAIIVSSALGAPSLLADDDARILGWWPISSRDLALARFAALLRPVLAGSAVLCALPVAAFAVVGPVPIVSALLLALAIVVQACAACAAVVAVVAGAVRLLGRQGARRLLLFVMTPLVVVPAALPGLLADSIARQPQRVEVLLAILPPAWFASWALVPADAAAAPLALSLITTLGVIPLAMRLVASGGAGEQVEARRARPRRAPLGSLAGALLVPFTPGREGRVMRRLVVAHVREEWRLGILRLAPLAALAAAVAVALAPESLAASAVQILPGSLGFRPVLLAPIAAVFLALPSVLLLLGSEDHDAAWLLAGSDLEPARMLGAARGAARALVGLPLVTVVAALHARAGSPLALAIPDVTITALMFDVALRAIQRRHLLWPFSRPWDGPPDDLVLAMAAGGVPLAITLLLLLAVGYDHGHVTRLAGCAILVPVIVALHRSIARAAATEGLRLEIVPRA